jgi:hypothetical protein
VNCTKVAYSILYLIDGRKVQTDMTVVRPGMERIAHGLRLSVDRMQPFHFPFVRDPEGNFPGRHFMAEICADNRGYVDQTLPKRSNLADASGIIELRILRTVISDIKKFKPKTHAVQVRVARSIDNEATAIEGSRVRYVEYSRLLTF